MEALKVRITLRVDSKGLINCYVNEMEFSGFGHNRHTDLEVSSIVATGCRGPLLSGEIVSRRGGTIFDLPELQFNSLETPPLPCTFLRLNIPPLVFHLS